MVLDLFNLVHNYLVSISSNVYEFIYKFQIVFKKPAFFLFWIYLRIGRENLPYSKAWMLKKKQSFCLQWILKLEIPTYYSPFFYVICFKIIHIIEKKAPRYSTHYWGINNYKTNSHKYSSFLKSVSNSGVTLYRWSYYRDSGCCSKLKRRPDSGVALYVMRQPLLLQICSFKEIFDTIPFMSALSKGYLIECRLLRFKIRNTEILRDFDF